jgi:hypothetical protein
VASVTPHHGAAVRDSVAIDVRHDPEAPAAIELFEPPTGGLIFEGVTYTPRFRVVDAAGAGVPGVRVLFELSGEDATISPAEAITDSLGVVAVSVVHTAAGQGASVEARVEGLSEFAWWFARPSGAPEVEILPGSIVVGEGCSVRAWGDVRFGGVSQMAQTVFFGAVDSSIVSLSSEMGSGNVRGQSLIVRGESLGKTLVTADYQGVAFDTAEVTVVPRAPVGLALSVYNNPIGIGGYASIGVSLRADCGADFPLPDLLARSLDPSVADVEAIDPERSVMIRGRTPGSARIEVVGGSYTDTAVVTVLPYRLMPADTTVVVGTAVQYRMIWEGKSPAPETTHSIFVLASQDPPFSLTLSGLLTATAVGVGKVSGGVVIRSGEATQHVWSHTTVRVVPPPASSRR